MLRQLTTVAFVASLVAACGIVPSDPGPRALGVSTSGPTLVAWLPNCDGDQLRAARVSRIDAASAGPALEGKTLWSARISPGEQPPRLALDAANPKLTQVSGDYAGESRLFIAVTGLVEYTADVQVSKLSDDRVLYRGASVLPADFPELASKECRAS